jgi:hypothetical protein
LVFVEAREIGGIQELTPITGEEGGSAPAHFLFPHFFFIRSQKNDPVPVKSPYQQTHQTLGDL